MQEHKKVLVTTLTIAFLLIPVLVAVLVRAPIYSLPIADDWARSTLTQNVQNQITNQVNQQYPTLPAESKNQLVQEQASKFITDNQAEFDAQAAQLADAFRAQLQDEDGHTYLPDLDPYHYLKLVERQLSQGYTGNELRDGVSWDTQRVAPIGAPANLDMFTKAVVIAHKTESLVHDTKPMYTMFWVNLFFVACATIFMLLIGRHKGIVAAFIAASIIALHPGNVSRTAAGVGDTESFVLFFSLLAAWLLFEAFVTPQGNWKRLAIFLGLAGLSFGLLARAWEWWFFFIIFFSALIANFGYTMVRQLLNGKSVRHIIKDKETWWAATLPGGFFVSAGVFVSLFVSVKAFVGAFAAPFVRTSSIKAATSSGIWPNVLTTVAELNQPDIGTIIANMGGKFLFIATILGLVFALLPAGKLKLKDWLLLAVAFLVGLFLVSPRGTSMSIIMFLAVFSVPTIVTAIVLLKDKRDNSMLYGIILVAWLLATIFAMTKGVRFLSLIIPPFAISVAIAAQAIFTRIADAMRSMSMTTKLWTFPLLFIVLLIPLAPLAQQGYQTGRQTAPSIDDGWWGALTAIKEGSQPDAIITSWWDFGHWFRYVADRGVTFDGATQHGELAHLIGLTLRTDSEKEALGILRMVDCGSDTAPQVIQDALPGNDQYQSIMLTKKIIMQDRPAAQKTLAANGIASDAIPAILALTHCDPPEGYYITSGDMVGKGGVWAHFGGWDFRKADAARRFSAVAAADATPQMQERYNITSEEASEWHTTIRSLNENQLNTWISSWPGYIMQSTVPCSPSADDPKLLVCPMGVVVQAQGSVAAVIDSLIVNTSDVRKSTIVVSSYENGRRMGSANLVPVSFVVLKNESSRVYVGDASSQVQLSAVIDLELGTAMMADPALADGLFTKLFYFEGHGTSAFTKFDDRRTLGGSRIITWKIDWSKAP